MMAPIKEEKAQTTGSATADAIVGVGKSIAGLGAQGMNNLILIGLAGLVGFMVYVERRDRMEQNRMQLRSFESQGELNRQSISNNTTAISALTVTVGRLDSSVAELQKEIRARQLQ